MAGYREFVTGEVLTAANVNQFLMEQAVMTFADATARDTALSGVLREGLVAYNLDTSELERYDGSAWGAIASEDYVDAEIATIPVLAGIGSNVVHAIRTTTFSTTSTSYTDWTDVEVTITPTTATSKVLVICNAPSLGGSTVTIRLQSLQVWRGATALEPEAIARTQGNGNRISLALHLLDSPETTSAVTYKARVKTEGDTVNFNSGVLTAVEVAA